MLGKFTQRTLQLDGRFAGDTLCFVVSKTDSSISVPRYIKTHANVEEYLIPESLLQERLKEVQNKLNEDYQELEVKMKAKNRDLKELKRELKQLQNIIKKSRPQKARKRKRSTGSEEPNPDIQAIPTVEEEDNFRRVKELNQEIGAGKDDIISFQAVQAKVERNIHKAVANIDLSKSRQTAVCIRNRNTMSATELRKDYDAAASMIPSAHQKPLQVFCVSAHAFWEFKKSNGLVPGFLRLEDTRIPQLSHWLEETTLMPRHRITTGYLEDIERLELSMAPWIETCSEFKMSPSEVEAVKDSFNAKLKILQDVSRDSQISIALYESPNRRQQIPCLNY